MSAVHNVGITSGKRCIRYVNRHSVQWFPGHMDKGMKNIHKIMPRIDFLIEVHDARIPFTGRPLFFQKFGLIRPTILLINKMDLCENVNNLSDYKNKLLQHYNQHGNLTKLYFTQLNSPEKQKKLLKQLFISLPKIVKGNNHEININDEFDQMMDNDTLKSPKIMGMVVGIPNSGKSTLINVLRNVGHGGAGGAARVGRTAGQTRTIGQPIIISRGNRQRNVDDRTNLRSLLDYRIELFDTPGILDAYARTVCQQLSLAVCGAVNLESFDQEVLVDYLLFWWNYRKKFIYVSVFNLTKPTDNVFELLVHVCVKHNFFISAQKYNRSKWKPVEVESAVDMGVANPQYDFRRATSYILHLFNKGVLDRATFLPEDEEEASKYFILST